MACGTDICGIVFLWGVSSKVFYQRTQQHVQHNANGVLVDQNIRACLQVKNELVSTDPKNEQPSCHGGHYL